MVNSRDISDLLLAIHSKLGKYDNYLSVVQTTSVSNKGNIKYKYSIEFYHKEKSIEGKFISVVDGREYFSGKDMVFQYLGEYYKKLVEKNDKKLVGDS